jgi:HAE1 family hydrophobic/amphiphilic exporter-1
MRFAHFFIDRPIFATVLSVLLVLLGSIAYVGLPVAQYPEIAPPTIQVRAPIRAPTPRPLRQLSQPR